MPGLNDTTLRLLTKFNHDYIQYRIPALIFLSLMLPLGIMGNASAIYVYGFRLKNTNVHLFITLLAVSDIISCLLCIPMEMYRLLVFYNYPSITACKVEGFVTIACGICSVLILLIISVERYLKVCNSTGTQVSSKMANILAGVVFFVSPLLTVPIAVFTEPRTYTLDDGTVVRNCIYHIERELWFFSVALFVFMISILVVMFSLYWRVQKAMLVHVTWTQQRRAQIDIDESEDVTQPPTPLAGTKKLDQTNRTVILISAVYAATCVPIFIVAIVTKFFTHLKTPNPLDSLLFILYQSWILNCTLNPIIYGFLNSHFYTEIRNLFNNILTRANSSSVEKPCELNQTGTSVTL